MHYRTQTRASVSVDRGAAVDEGLPTTARDQPTKRKRRRRPRLGRYLARAGKQDLKALSLLVLVVIIFVLFTIHYFLIHNYAWVHRRCWKRYIVWTTKAAVECVEAATHERSDRDPTLHDFQPILFRSTPARHVHYTITTGLSQQVLDLAECSLEAMRRLCQIHNCTVNVWIVEQAALDVNNKESDHESLEWYRRIQRVFQDDDTAPPPLYCLRISLPNETGPDHATGSHCPQSTLSCPIIAQHTHNLRQWLKTDLASNQLPAHQSDAWRTLATAEFGGLYLDADVLPLHSNILYLPALTIPTQYKVGAYRMNGGVLRIPSYSTSNEESTTCRGSFLDALLRDHLEWAPRLAKQDLEDQTFGFLGPCALTRVYTSRESFREEATVLSHSHVEGSSLCTNDEQIVAHHFSGGHKKVWLSLLRDPCVKDKVQSMCPRTFETLPY